MSTNYSPELVTDGAVFVGDARESSTATAGSRLYDQAGVDSTAVKLLIHGNEGSGQSFTDSSLSNIPITAVGHVTHSTAESKFSGGSIFFDGTGDYLNVGNSSATYTDVFYDVNGLDFTYDFWVYRTGSGRRGLISSHDNSSNYDDIEIEFTSANKIMGGFRTTAMAFLAVTTTTALAVDTWYHVAMVRQSGILKIYLNGILEATNGTTYTGNIQNRGGVLLVGKYAALDHQGYMDEIRITIGSALWTQNFTPPARRDTLSISDGMMYNGSCVDLDGTDDYIDCGTALGTNFGDNYSGGFTVSLWFKLDAADKGLFNISSFSNSYGAMSFYVSGSELIFRLASDVSTKVAMSDTSNWHHVVGTYDGSTIKKIYLDGALGDSDSYTADLDLDGLKTIIGGFYSSSYCVDGKIADVRVYSTALSADSVKEIYNDSKVIIPSDVSQTNLKGWWPLVDGAGTIAYDGSGNGNHGTLTNMTSADWLTGQTGAPQLVEGYNRPMQFDNDGALSGGPTLVATNDYTFSWWCRSTQTTDNQNLFSSGGTAVGGFHLNWSTTNNALLYLAGNNYTYWSAGAAQDDGKWHHWLITYYGTASSDRQARDSSLYIDGVLIGHGSFTDSAAPSAWGDFRIGTNSSTGTFEGGINEFIIYEGMLGSVERAQLYATGANGGPLPPDPMSFSNSSDIIAYWRNDDATTWKNRGPQVIKNFTNVATDPINDSNAIGDWTHNGNFLTSVTGGRTGFIDGAMRVAPRYRLLFDSGTNHTVNSIVAVTEGKSYKVSAWYLAGTVSSAMLRVDGPGLSTPVSIGPFTTNTTSWTNKTATFRATATANVTIELHNRATGTQYFDDVTLVESGPALDLTAGGSPDVTLIKQGINGSDSTSAGRDGQGFPLKYKDVGAIGFDGSSTYIEVAAPSGGGLDITTNITLASWCFAASKSNWNRVIARRATASSALPYMLGLDDSTDQKWNFYIDGSSGATSFNSSGPASTNTWVYVVGVLRGTSMEIYLNGVLDNSTTHLGGLDAGATDPNVQIGSQLMPASTSYVWDGQIANAQIYNRGLSSAEILQNYNAQRSRFE